MDDHHTRVNGKTGRWVKALQESVITWFSANGRDFPWRNTKNPFYILIAEVLLRQTQSTRLVKPYLELTSKYPDANTLARANVGELRAWFKPLGLVKRADYLVQTAHVLVDDYQGQVPNDLKALVALPGLGVYSARAILCLAFGMPVPMIDEGSGRVLRRLLKSVARGPAYSDSQLLQKALSILPEHSVRQFNLSLIDIASAYCHVNLPNCLGCPLVRVCTFAMDSAKKG